MVLGSDDGLYAHICKCFCGEGADEWSNAMCPQSQDKGSSEEIACTYN